MQTAEQHLRWPSPSPVKSWCTPFQEHPFPGLGTKSKRVKQRAAQVPRCPCPWDRKAAFYVRPFSNGLRPRTPGCSKNAVPKWLALVSRKMGTKTCGLPLRSFNFEPQPPRRLGSCNLPDGWLVFLEGKSTGRPKNPFFAPPPPPKRETHPDSQPCKQK